MTAEQWKKLKRHLSGAYNPASTCPICNGKITEDDNPEDITYSKTKGGTHVFMHEACLFKKN